MKVVINRRFGGFGLSTEAMKMLIALNSKGVKTMTEDEYHGGHGRDKWGIEKYQDAGDGFEVSFISDVLYKDGNVYMYDDDNRTDEALVKVVKELKEAANGRCAKLKIVTVPDGVDFEIEEYDGLEHVAEKHRTWS